MTTVDSPDMAERLVAFINTRHCPDGDDVLADERGPAWLASWLGRDDANPHVQKRGALLTLQDLREGLRELAAANNGQEPDAETIQRAATVLASVPVVVRLGDDVQAPDLIADTDADPAQHAIAAIAQSYLTVRADGGWSRVKSCAARDCRWAYVDTSRNRSRRWCDMTNCGNRAKNRTWRERVRTAEHAD